MFDPYKDAISILYESVPNSKDYGKLKVILEDTNSPVTSSYIERLYDSVITKGHIDFDDIPKSKGDIRNYSGHKNVVDVLINIYNLAAEQGSANVISYVKTIQEAISNIVALGDTYQKGFRMKCEYVMLEYNTYVYTIVQATSCILYEFVDYIKRPDRDTIDITIKNNKFKANLFYVEQLTKFNNVVRKMEYKKFLEAMISKGKENFIGAETAIGIAAVAIVSLAIIPVTRELIYQFYHLRSNLSDCLAQQAYFLEMNKANVESNSSITVVKKKQILDRQKKLQSQLIRLADKLKVNHVMSADASAKQLKTDNGLLTVNRIKRDIGDSPLTLV